MESWAKWSGAQRLKVVGHVVSVLCLRTCASQGSLAEAKARPPSCPLVNVIYQREVSLNRIIITSLRAIRRRPWCELIAAASKSYFAHFLDLAVSGLFRHYVMIMVTFGISDALHTGTTLTMTSSGKSRIPHHTDAARNGAKAAHGDSEESIGGTTSTDGTTVYA